MESSDPAIELLSFVSKTTRSTEIRIHATEYFAGLTGSEDGRQILYLNAPTKLSDLLVELLEDTCKELNIKAHSAIVNLSSDRRFCDLLTTDSLLSLLFQFITISSEENVIHAEKASMALSNIAHWEEGAFKVMTYLKKREDTLILHGLIDKFFKTTNGLHYLGSFLANLTQNKEARKILLDEKKLIFQRLLSFISFKDSKIRQHGVVAAIKNCSFETDSHLWLLSENVEILPLLLLPLAGPEDFDEDDMEKLPLDLQYLGSDKEREPHPKIRKMLIETINQLCTTKAGRKIVKDFNAYVILRELHKWETEDSCVTALENLISVLISDEPQEGMEDLNKVEIPTDLEEKMNKLVVSNQ